MEVPSWDDGSGSWRITDTVLLEGTSWEHQGLAGAGRRGWRGAHAPCRFLADIIDTRCRWLAGRPQQTRGRETGRTPTPTGAVRSNLAHHKRKRPKNRRAGCLLCKPWKVNGFGKTRLDAEQFSAHRARAAADQAVRAARHGAFE